MGEGRQKVGLGAIGGIGHVSAGIEAIARLSLAIPDLCRDPGQHSVACQVVIDVAVEELDVFAEIPVEQFEDDDLYIHPGFDLEAGGLEGVADGLGADGIGFRRQFFLIEQESDPLIEGEQFAVAKGLQFVYQGIDGKGLFQVVVFHQAKSVLRNIDTRVPGHRGPVVRDQSVGGLAEVVPEGNFDLLTLDADFPHGIKVVGLQGIGAGLVRQGKQRVVHIVHGACQRFGDALQGPVPAVMQQPRCVGRAEPPDKGLMLL